MMLDPTYLPPASQDVDSHYPLDLSILLVNWNTCAMLRDCIQSILENTSGISYELFVIDNASTDQSVEMVRSEYPGVYVIANSINMGFSSANNQGILKASGRHVMLLNPDTLITGNILADLIEFLDSTPDAGAVAPKLLNSDGSLQYSIRHFPNLLTPFTENSVLMRTKIMRAFVYRSRMEDWEHDSVQTVEQPAGAAFIVKRAIIETLGCLDNDYHMFFEDVDLCLRIWMNGWKIYYYPHGNIIHHGGQSVQKRQNIGAEFYKSLRCYFRKHFGPMGEMKIRGSMITGSLFFVLYSLGLVFKNPRQAYSVAKTAYAIMRGGIRKYRMKCSSPLRVT